MRAAFDLGEFASSLDGGTGPRERFKAAIRRCRGVHAELTDLRGSLQFVEMLAELTAVAGGRADGKFTYNQGLQARALLMSAVIQYVRATHSNSNHKPKAGYAAVLNDDQLQLHLQLVKLRDDTLAHWGPGDDWAGGRWYDHRVVLAHLDGEEGIANPSYQTNTAVSVPVGLQTMAKVAIPIALDRLKIARDEVYAALESLFGVEADLRDKATAFRFDPVEFYQGRTPLVEAFWARRDAFGN